jgi:NAD(P)-dependent dehydrogenase (short-subunit alcohol dehydrogenase family)
MQISGVSAVVTGANGGLGKCLVDQLLTRGAGRVYAAGRERASLDSVASVDPDRVSPLVLDITDDTQAPSRGRIGGRRETGDQQRRGDGLR